MQTDPKRRAAHCAWKKEIKHLGQGAVEEQVCWGMLRGEDQIMAESGSSEHASLHSNLLSSSTDNSGYESLHGGLYSSY